MIQVKINGLALDMTTNSPVVILAAVDSKEKLLPIWIGHYEAWAIATELSGIKSKRPLTHDLLKSVIKSMDGEVKKVEVTQLVDQTFYAKIYVDLKGNSLEIDARPSDSIALALKTGVPIFVAEELFQLKGTSMKKQDSLRERLKRLNPEDFGKYSLG
jgi:bifunctional DNase/RNase